MCAKTSFSTWALTEPAERDEAGHHEGGVCVELPLRVLAPGVPVPVVKRVEDDEDERCQQQQTGKDHNQDVLAPVATGHALLVVISLPATNNQNIHHLRSRNLSLSCLG